MKRKNPGVSLIVVLGISFAVLGIAMATLSSVSKGLEQGTAIERSNQIFFAAESGVEAALFHHNARGQGINFPNSDAEVNDEFLQHIFLPSSAATVAWKIEGRDKPVEGIMHENQTIELPFYWDNSANPAGEQPIDESGNFDPGTENAGKLDEAFSLTFDTSSSALDVFDFGGAENEVFLDWSVSRKHANSGFQTFLPDKNGVAICAEGSSFICETEFLDGDAFALDSTEDSGMVGKIFPGNTASSLSEFLAFDDDTFSMFKLSFRPLLPFTHIGDIETPDDDAKIAGIPFSFDHVGAGEGAITVPKSIYTVTSEVSIGDFSRTIRLDVPEKTTVGSFDYVIFD